VTGDEVLELMRATGCLLEGHFRLSSGRHSARYLQCAQILQYPEHAARLGAELARRLMAGTGAVEPFSAVVGPALGGIIVAHEVARAAGARALFTERVEGVMALRRGFALKPGERVAVVEDVVTTGGSADEVLAAVRFAGAVPVALGAVVDRSNGASLELPLVALVKVSVDTWDAAECPLCQQGIPVVKPGSRPS
jgi:orotate phosphoribosyltransferase